MQLGSFLSFGSQNAPGRKQGRGSRVGAGIGRLAKCLRLLKGRAGSVGSGMEVLNHGSGGDVALGQSFLNSLGEQI